MLKIARKCGFKRIHVIGGPGSGKSYLGKKISELLRIKNYNLDRLYYKTPSNKRAKEFNKIISKDEWVIEGHWHDWVKAGFERADIIIFLDVSLVKRDLNLLKRAFKRMFNAEEGRKVSIMEFLGIIRLNHSWDKSKAKKILKRYNNKILTFKKADKAIGYIKSC